MLPPVSLPIPAKQRPAATAAPAPELEPPVIWPVFQGFRAGPVCGLIPVAPSAISCKLSVPRTIAPAARRRRVTSESSSETTSWKISDAAVIGAPATAKMSLSATGMPCSGPRYPPLAISSAASRAAARASPASTVMKALSRPSSASTRARQASTRSTGESSRRSISRAAAAIESQCRSVAMDPLAIGWRRNPHGRRAALSRYEGHDRGGQTNVPACDLLVHGDKISSKMLTPKACAGR